MSTLKEKAKTAQAWLNSTNNLEMLREGVIYNSDLGNCDPKAKEYKQRIDAIHNQLLVPLEDVEKLDTEWRRIAGENKKEAEKLEAKIGKAVQMLTDIVEDEEVSPIVLKRILEALEE